MIYIAAINLTTRHVLTDTGQVYPITNFYDGAGDECEPEDALSAVAGADGTWFAFDPHCDVAPLVVH